MIVRLTAHRWNWFAGSLAIGLEFIASLRTTVSQGSGTDALSVREGNGCIFSTKTTLCCRGFTSACAKEPSTATLARSFAGTRWQIQKEIRRVYLACTVNLPAYLTTGTRGSPFRTLSYAQPSLFEDASTSSLEVFCRDCTTFLIGRCGNELHLNFLSGLSPQFSLVIEYIPTLPHRA